MPDTQDAPVVIESPASEPARFFRLDPHTSVEITCPECCEIVGISDDHVFDPDVGVPLGHEATLGDLVDAANNHVCWQANEDA